MIYELDFADQAKGDLARLKRDEPSAYKKATILLAELRLHPRTGTGKPEALTGDRAGQWSRRINRQHRLIYEIHDAVVKVYVLASWGHYNDK